MTINKYPKNDVYVFGPKVPQTLQYMASFVVLCIYIAIREENVSSTHIQLIRFNLVLEPPLYLPPDDKHPTRPPRHGRLCPVQELWSHVHIRLICYNGIQVLTFSFSLFWIMKGKKNSLLLIKGPLCLITKYGRS